MSAATTDAAGVDQEATPESEAVSPDRSALVDARAKAIYADLVKANTKLSPAERESDNALWKQASAQARKQLRHEAARAHAKKVATNLLADLGSALHRNRRQLAPWSITAPYAFLGLGAWLLARFGSGVPAGIAFVTALLAAGLTLLLRFKLEFATPPAYRLRLRTGLFGLTGWAALMPLTTWVHPAGMWLLLVACVAWQSLGWWRENDHPIPLPANLADINLEELDLSELDLTSLNADELTALGLDPQVVAALGATGGDVEQAQDLVRERERIRAREDFAQRLAADWEVFVAGKGTLTGSALTTNCIVQYGVEFHLNLVRGKQTIADVHTAKAKFCPALNVDATMLSIDHGPDQSTVVITVLTEKPANTYDGPVIIRRGGDIYIELGPHVDGKSNELFHVLSGQLTDEELAAGEVPAGSMHGGFALGTKGSGKSRLIEAIAVGLRKLGVEIWYLDPQEGKSSPALMAEADWPFSGLHGSGGEFANVVKMWKALKAVNELRSLEGAHEGHQGFQHTRERPAIMAIIDENHVVFQAINPETGNTFGADFAALDRVMRKNGMGILGASQGVTVDNFGGNNAATVLRDGMCASNVYALAYSAGNPGLLPGYDGQPISTLPTNLGYGYNTRGERPHVRFQARYTRNYRPWLQQLGKATLDVRAQKCIGKDYLDRFIAAKADRLAVKARLDRVDAVDGDASAVLFEQPSTPRAVSARDRLLSPAQRRQQAAEAAAPAGENVTEDPAEDAMPDAGTKGPALTEAERRVLGLVRTAPQTPTSLAAEMTITPQGAGKHLRNLTDKGQLIKNDNGTYSAV